MMLRRKLLTCKPLWSIKPSFLNLFMKEFTRARLAPTICASHKKKTVEAGIKFTASPPMKP